MKKILIGKQKLFELCNPLRFAVDPTISWDQCIFLLKGKIFPFGIFFPKRKRKIFRKFQDFSENPLENERKIVFETYNIQNFRLRRAKMTYFKGNIVQNRSKFVKIAPEGGEQFWGRKICLFQKSNKKTLVGTRVDGSL